MDKWNHQNLIPDVLQAVNIWHILSHPSHSIFAAYTPLYMEPLVKFKQIHSCECISLYIQNVSQ